MAAAFKIVSGKIAVGAVFAMGVWGLAAHPAVAQSAECLNPRGLVQLTVCRDGALADLSQELRQSLRVVMRSIPRRARPQLLRDQRDWSLQRNRCARSQDIRECLRAAYEDRIADLGQALAGTVGGGQVPPAQRRYETVFPNRNIVRAPGDLTQPPQPGADATFDATNGIARRAPVRQQPLPRLQNPPVGSQTNAESRVASPAVAVPNPAPVARKVEPEEAGPPAIAQPQVPSDTQVALAQPQEADAPDAPDGPSGDIAATLSAGVWRAEITSGIRPGTIYVFHRNGVLLTADCVQAYKLGSWKVAGNGEIVMAMRQGQALRGRVIKMRDRFVRMQIKKKSGAILRTLVLRPAVNPFDCAPGQK
ncbi:MAG: hypothetical protein ACTSY1_00320 [Alphaproteobacteria bacterium]